jgi:tetratricopeptide (TPR) repeat protein
MEPLCSTSRRSSDGKEFAQIGRMKTVILDTNVLLADPGSLLGFPDAHVVIPETVLGELDKLKTSRVDPDLRFRGREVSRILFDLSEQGSLIGGVDLPDGGRLSVVPLDAEGQLPDGLATRNADDRILAVAYQLTHKVGADKATLITNDLNMLLKAQTYGVPVERYGDGTEASFTRRYIVRPFQRYKIPLGILAISLAVFAAIVVVAVYYGPGRQSARTAAVPQEFKQLLSAQQRSALDYLTTLQGNPNDTESLRGMGDYYYDLREQSSNVRFALQAVEYYERYLKLQPDDPNVRTDLAVEYFYTGQTDKAIKQTAQVVDQSPRHLQANYWLGIFYWQAERHDYEAAAAQLKRVMELTEKDADQHAMFQQAQLALAQVAKDAETAGTPLPSVTETPTGGFQ